MPERPRATRAVAAGVLACVLVAAVLGALKLDEALGLYDFRADENASLGYLERVYGDEGVVMSRSVVEERSPTCRRTRAIASSSAPTCVASTVSHG